MAKGMTNGKAKGMAKVMARRMAKKGIPINRIHINRIQFF
jgi:hypothetical protein